MKKPESARACKLLLLSLNPFGTKVWLPKLDVELSRSTAALLSESAAAFLELRLLFVSTEEVAADTARIIMSARDWFKVEAGWLALLLKDALKLPWSEKSSSTCFTFFKWLAIIEHKPRLVSLLERELAEDAAIS